MLPPGRMRVGAKRQSNDGFESRIDDCTLSNPRFAFLNLFICYLLFAISFERLSRMIFSACGLATWCHHISPFQDPIVQWPRTLPFHGSNTGSNPVRVASIKAVLLERKFLKRRENTPRNWISVYFWGFQISSDVAAH